MRITLSLLLCLVCALAVVGQASKEPQLVYANGQTYQLAGRDKFRQADELVAYSLEFYQKKTPSEAGIDIYLDATGQVVEIKDRAKAVFLENKPDPGPLEVKGKDGFVLSGNGAARRWLLANLKVGDKVRVGSASAVVVSIANQPEIAPPVSAPCFAGAYYRKAVSSFDAWTGLAGFVKLGTPQVDEKRLSDDKQPLDNFSVYLGGNAGNKQEVDAGLTWEFTVDEKGQKSPRRNAFRPFWRVSGTTPNWNSAPAQKDYYWYPGDIVQMAIFVVGPGKLRLIVADAVPPVKRMFQTDFDAPAFAPNIPRQFKRVNAIDQVRNEGKPVQPTNAKITGAQWLQTILLRGAGADAKQLPLTPERYTDMRCPATNVKITASDAERAKGSEMIDLFGTAP